MKKKILLVLLTVALIVSVVAVGCAAPAPAPAPAPVPAAGPEKITWMFGYWGPATHPQIAPSRRWAENVAARVWPEYDFEMKWAYGGVIAGQSDILNATGAGMQDIGRWMPSKGPGKSDLSALGSLPVLPEDYEVASTILLEFFRTSWIVDEYATWNCMVIASSMASPQEIALTWPGENLADLEGRKIRMWGAYGKIFEKAGAVPIMMAVAEAYEALQRGTVEGALTGYPDSMIAYHWQDICKNILITGTGPTGWPVIMNSDSWNALPTKVKEAMIAESDVSHGYAKSLLEAAEIPAFEKFEEAGVVIRDCPPADKARVKSLVYEVVDEAVADLDKKGLPGSECWAKLKEIIAKWS